MMSVSFFLALCGLCKLKVVALILLTAIVGMFLAVPYIPDLTLVAIATLGIGLSASSAAVFNHVIDAHIDKHMSRTNKRPLVKGLVTKTQAIVWGMSLGIAGISILFIWVNTLTAVLTFVSLIGYAVFYTIYLKHTTPQNIVIGGAAGAAPPVLGWAAITAEVHAYALLLFLIIFIWTPPHFWALAIYRYKEYAKADVPMLPVTHGLQFTRLHILLYTILLFIITLLPYLSGMSGVIYLIGAVILNGIFVYYATSVYLNPDNDRIAYQTFMYSVNYLMVLFLVLLVDHYLLFTLR